MKIARSRPSARTATTVSRQHRQEDADPVARPDAERGGAGVAARRPRRPARRWSASRTGPSSPSQASATPSGIARGAGLDGRPRRSRTARRPTSAPRPGRRSRRATARRPALPRDREVVGRRRPRTSPGRLPPGAAAPRASARRSPAGSARDARSAASSGVGRHATPSPSRPNSGQSSRGHAADVVRPAVGRLVAEQATARDRSTAASRDRRPVGAAGPSGNTAAIRSALGLGHDRVGRGDDADSAPPRRPLRGPAATAWRDVARVDVAPQVPRRSRASSQYDGKAGVVVGLHDVRDAQPDEGPIAGPPRELRRPSSRRRASTAHTTSPGAASIVSSIGAKSGGRVERQAEHRLRRRPDHPLDAGAVGRGEHVVGRQRVDPEGLAVGPQLRRRDRGEVDHGIGTRSWRRAPGRGRSGRR